MPSKKRKDTKKTTDESSAAKESPFVSYEKLVETIDVLKKWTLLDDKQKSDKKELFKDTADCVVSLQVNYKKTPLNKSTYIFAISLPNHWRHESSDFETCLIVKDVNKTPLSDRDLDLTETKNHYRELLSKDNSDQLVSEILPMRELRNEYKIFESKEKLCKAFNVFLCDRRLLHNKFDYLPMFLGKSFWINDKKVPLPIDLTSTSLKSVLESKLNQTHLYLSGKGDMSSVNIGLLKQSTDKLAENLMAVNILLLKEFGNNIRSLSVKTEKSISITYFLDCGFISDIQMVRKSADNKPLEDEFSHFVDSNIQVFKNGNIRVVPKQDVDLDKSEKIDEIESKWLSMTRKRDNKKKNKRKRLSAHKPNKRRKIVKKSVEQKSD